MACIHVELTANGIQAALRVAKRVVSSGDTVILMSVLPLQV